jgi:hypothetical protein
VPKRLQLLRELIPDAVLFAVLGDASAELQAAARTLGLQIIVANPGTDSELETAFATFSQKRARGVLVPNGPFYNPRMDQLAALAARHAAGLGSAVAWPVVVRAQQRAMPVIRYLNIQSADNYKFVTVPFLQSLKENGYVEGQNVAIVYRSGSNFRLRCWSAPTR